MNYDLVFVLAIPLGGYLGYLIRRKNYTKVNDKEESKVCNFKSEKNSFLNLYLPSFIGGFLLLYGARMAGGCTSGHMMSGMMQGALSGYIFAGSVFIVAIPTAIFIKRKRLKRGE